MSYLVKNNTNKELDQTV